MRVFTLVAVVTIIGTMTFLMYRAYVGVKKGEITIMPLIGNFAYNSSYGKDGGDRTSRSSAAAERFDALLVSVRSFIVVSPFDRVFVLCVPCLESGRAPEVPSTGAGEE